LLRINQSIDQSINQSINQRVQRTDFFSVSLKFFLTLRRRSACLSSPKYNHNQSINQSKTINPNQSINQSNQSNKQIQSK